MEFKRFLDITDFSREGLREALNLMAYIKENRSAYAAQLEKRTVATVFTEGARNSEAFFKCAVTRMGGMSFDFKLSEGETLKDAAAVLTACSDIIVLNHPKKGAARAMSMYAGVPVVNAGDGGRAYPVQTLADFATVWNEKKHVSNMKIGFLGDFSNNALARNLLQCLNLYNGNEFYFVSVNGKPLSDEYIKIMDKRDKAYSVYDNLFDVLPELDLLYMTKVEKSSFDSEIMYEARKHNFILDERLMMTAKPGLMIMHAFPKGEEVDPFIDSLPNAAYYSQMDYTVDACTAILLKLVMNRAGRIITPCYEEKTHDAFCGADDCITSTEEYLPPLFHETADGTLICKYCGRTVNK